MTRLNFRVKVDLSRYYHDARRSCWIFIDCTKILQISDVKQHITKLFNIPEPYYLCLNDTDYLPPAEDARIIKENEMLVVLPGTGLRDEIQSSVNSKLPYMRDSDSSNKERNKMFYHKEVQTIEFPVTKQIISTEDKVGPNELLYSSKEDISSSDITFHSIINDKECDNDIDFKTMDNNIDDSSIIQKELSNTKRKRIRYRKKKKEVTAFVDNAITDANSKKKPTIIDSFVVPSGKHVRFAFERNDTELLNHINNDTSTNDQCAIESLQYKELSTLLALRHSSTPITFTNKKMKEEIGKLENTSDKEERDIEVLCEKENETLNNIIKDQTLSDTEFQKYPLVKNDVQSNDIIAFKILNYGRNYSPQVSKVIIAQIISFFPQTGACNLRIIKGLDEIHFGKVPLGKFSIPEDENETIKTDIIDIHYTQMIEPRFIKRLSVCHDNLSCQM